MSVINQMLKDLEQRRQQGVRQGDVLDGLSWQSERRTSKLVPALLLVIVLVVAVGAWFAYQYRSTRHLANDAGSGSAEQATTAAAPLATPTASDARQQPPAIENTPPDEAPAAAEAIAPGSVASPGQQAPAETVTAEIVTVLPRIDRLRPSLVPATGKPTTISLYGEGFVAPLRVIASWDGGAYEKELPADQVSVVSDSRLAMTINPGTQTGDWQVQIINDHGEVSNAYAFRAKAPLPAQPEQPVVQADSHSPVANEQAGKVIKTVRQRSAAERARERMDEASRQLAQGDMRRGEKALREALQLDAGLHAARELLAGLLIQQGRQAEAGEVLDAGLLQPDVPASTVLLRARVYTEQQQEGEAVRVLESNQPTITGAIDYYALLAALYQRRARHADAVNLYRQLLQLHPRQAVWQMGLGISLEAIGQRADAITAYEAALNSGLQGELHGYVSQRLQALK